MHPPLVPRVLDLATQIQQIPAPTFSESRRLAFIRQRFEEQGLSQVGTDHVGNLYACLPGTGSAPPLVVSAHCDTVFPQSTRLEVTRESDKVCGPGIGDNSLGVAGLFGLLWGLKFNDQATFTNLSTSQTGLNSDHRSLERSALPGDLWLVCNVGEEGLGDLCGMRAVVDRFGDAPLAYIVLEGMALGQVYHRALGVRRYRVTSNTQGGHSWVDFGRPSAIHALSALVTRLTALDLAESPRTTLNVGVISGGTSINTIAAQAYLELDLRSEGPQTLENLTRQVEALVRAFDSDDVRFECQQIGNRPAGELSSNHALVRLAQRSLKRLGIQPSLNIGSTDANIPLSRGIPAICLGLTTGGGAHTIQEYINIPPLTQGLQQLVLIVRDAFKELI
ncbi:MAG TPA: M20/M25/M40 family metallo-hydrolase [Anaerolineales bacterium]